MQILPAILCLAVLAATPQAPSLDAQLIAASRRGDLEAARALLDKGADVDAKDRYDVTPLFIAALRGNLPLAQLLLERGASVNVRDTFYKSTPVGMALGGSAQNLDLVALLVSKGADDVGRALSAGIEADHSGVLDAVLATGKLSPRVLSGGLLVATRTGKEAAARALRAAGARLPDRLADDVIARYTGNYASERGDIQIVGEDGVLLARLGSAGSDMPLVAESESVFHPATVEGVRVVFALGEGRATGLTLETGRGPTVYKRVEGR